MRMRSSASRGASNYVCIRCPIVHRCHFFSSRSSVLAPRVECCLLIIARLLPLVAVINYWRLSFRGRLFVRVRGNEVPFVWARPSCRLLLTISL